MAENRLKTFIQGHRGVVDRYVMDVSMDREFPDAQSWEELEAYLRHKNANIEAGTLADARHLWNEYAKENSKTR